MNYATLFVKLAIFANGLNKFLVTGYWLLVISY